MASTTCFSPHYVLCMIGIIFKMGSLKADRESLVTHGIRTATSTQVATFIAIYSTLSNIIMLPDIMTIEDLTRSANDPSMSYPTLRVGQHHYMILYIFCEFGRVTYQHIMLNC